jgi:hypothetical protein
MEHSCLLATRSREASLRSEGGLVSNKINPPPWAATTADDQGRIIHERLSPRHPLTTVDFIEGARPTDVSVAVADVRDGWERRGPTVQVEGGSYGVKDAWQLYRALRELLTLVGEAEPAA